MVGELTDILKKIDSFKVVESPELLKQYIHSAISIIRSGRVEEDQNPDSIRMAVITQLESMLGIIDNAYESSNNFFTRKQVLKPAINNLVRTLVVYLSRFDKPISL